MTPEVLFLLGRVGIALVTALGGVLALVYGYKLYSTGVGLRADGTRLKYGASEARLGTVGGTLMLTSAAWAGLAYLCLPKALEVDGDKSKLAISPELPEQRPFIVKSAAGTSVLECERKRETVVCFELSPGAKCGPPPPFLEGIGRLQIGRSAASQESDRLETVGNMERSLRKVLSERKADTWRQRLMSYAAAEGGEKVHRLVFNGIAPELEAPLCTWLQCEGWTFGPCEMVAKDTD